MAADYKKIEFRLHEYLVQMENMLTLMKADEQLLLVLKNDKELIHTKKYNVAVMGEFKRGKSSLVNALLGYKILPADVEPTTATINRITFGQQLKAVVFFKDKTKIDVDINELSAYVTKLTPEGASRAALVEEAVVFSPTVICQNHVDIIDTPGLNDDERMTKITIDMLNNVDAVIVTIHAKAPFSITERNFICQLIKSENIGNIVIVVTFIDQLEEDDFNYDEFISYIKNRIYSEVLEKLKNDNEPDDVIKKASVMLKELSIFGISAALALKFFLSNDKNALKESRFEVFKTKLMQIVTAKQVENVVQKTVRDIKRILAGLSGLHDRKTKLYAGRITEAAEHNRLIAEFCSQTGKKLNSSFIAQDQKMKETVNSQNSLNNVLAQGFIKELAKIRTVEHSVIEKIITTAALEQKNHINSTVLPAVKNDLLSLFAQIINNFEKDLCDSLTVPLNELNIMDTIDFKKIKDEINSLINKEAGNVVFSWAGSIIPNVPDLSNHNVIEHIKKVINASVEELKKSLNNFIDSARMIVYKCINKNSDAIILRSSQAEQDKKQATDIKAKAFVNNYEEFSQTAKDILRNSEQILLEVTK